MDSPERDFLLTIYELYGKYTNLFLECIAFVHYHHLGKMSEEEEEEEKEEAGVRAE